MSVKVRQNRGFSLMEVLVALLMLSVGLLGTGKMVEQSVTFADTALIRSQSVALAYDLADRIRSNSMSFDEYSIGMGETIDTPPDCMATACNGNQLAENDLAEWKDRIGDALPGGDGSSVIAADDATVTVSWNNRGQAGNFVLVVSR